MLSPQRLDDMVRAAALHEWGEVCAAYLDLLDDAQGPQETTIVRALMPKVGAGEAERLAALMRKLRVDVRRNYSMTA